MSKTFLPEAQCVAEGFLSGGDILGGNRRLIAGTLGAMSVAQGKCSSHLLPQLIPRSLLSRHEMSTFLRRIDVLHPKTFPKTEGVESADSTPTVLSCAYSLGRHEISSCRARPCARVPSAGGFASDGGDL
jgi:hypothetical protein